MVVRLPLIAACFSLTLGLVLLGVGREQVVADPLNSLQLLGGRGPDGGARLAWRWTGAGTPPGQIALVRGVSVDALAPGADANLHPTARWQVKGGAVGTFADAWAADGTPYFYQARAGDLVSAPVAIATAPRALPPTRRARLEVDKAHFVLGVLEGDKLLKRYPIAIGRLPRKRKLHFDNASTPEGRYHVIALQPRATYYRAFDLDYPNALDRARWAAARNGKADFPAIGGEIQIHGGGALRENWTYGCMALRNEDIDELFDQRIVKVGTEVSIYGGELSRAEVMALK